IPPAPPGRCQPSAGARRARWPASAPRREGGRMTGSGTGTLAGRVAVVTGAAGEIGAAYSTALAEAGACVIEADLAFPAKLERSDGPYGNRARLHVDVADASSTRELGDVVRREFGRCDILVNNAAIYRGMRLDPQLTVDIGYWRKVFGVNVDGALLCTQA